MLSLSIQVTKSRDILREIYGLHKQTTPSDRLPLLYNICHLNKHIPSIMHIQGWMTFQSFIGTPANRNLRLGDFNKTYQNESEITAI